jgi:hypothetical protein
MNVEAPTRDSDTAHDHESASSSPRREDGSPPQVASLAEFDVEGLCIIAPETLQILAAVGC